MLSSNYKLNSKYKYLTLHHDAEQGLYLSAPETAAAFYDPNSPNVVVQRQACGARPNTQYAVVYPTVG